MVDAVIPIASDQKIGEVIGVFSTSDQSATVIVYPTDFLYKALHAKTGLHIVIATVFPQQPRLPLAAFMFKQVTLEFNFGAASLVIALELSVAVIGELLLEDHHGSQQSTARGSHLGIL